jgi:signal peptidase I
MNKAKIKKAAKKVWHFLWEEDSILSWVVNIVLAFVLIKFIIYPGIGFVLGTDYPVVAVVSGSMEHKTVNPCVMYGVNRQCQLLDKQIFEICGKKFSSRQDVTTDFFWKNCGYFYESRSIAKEDFSDFDFKNGFNTGDIIVLKGVKPENIEIGDVVVFSASQAYPIIHRVVDVKKGNGILFFSTKGDHNVMQTMDDVEINQDDIIGKAVFRIPYLGWVKIGFFNLLGKIGIIQS